MYVCVYIYIYIHTSMYTHTCNATDSALLAAARRSSHAWRRREPSEGRKIEAIRHTV